MVMAMFTNLMNLVVFARMPGTPTPTLPAEDADSRLGRPELLNAVRALARRGTVSDERLLRRPVPSGTTAKRWYEPFSAGD
jgi:hypothetical protein